MYFKFVNKCQEIATGKSVPPTQVGQVFGWFAQACDYKFATLKWFTPVPGLGPELCHDRGPALPHPWDRRGLALPRPWDCQCVGVTVALGVSSVMVSGLASGRCTRAPLWPLLPSTDTRVVSVVLRVRVLRSTHNFNAAAKRSRRLVQWSA